VHFSGFSSAFLPLPALSHTVTHSFTTNTDTHTHAWHSEEMKMQTDEKEERVKVKCNGLLKAAMTFSFKLCTSLELPRRHAPRPYTPLHTHKHTHTHRREEEKSANTTDKPKVLFQDFLPHNSLLLNFLSTHISQLWQWQLLPSLPEALSAMQIRVRIPRFRLRFRCQPT